MPHTLRVGLTALFLGQAGAVSAQPPVAPTVVDFIPKRNALAVPRNTNVTAIFDQALNIPSNALKVFSFQAGGMKAGQAAIVDRNLIYNPTTDFKAGETVFGTVTSNVRVGPSQPLPKPQTFQFTTATAPSSGTFGGGSDVGGNAVGDVDGDGDLDLLAVNTASNSVRVRLNNGTGSFTDGPEVAVGLRPVGVTLGDLDNDGDLDLVTANNSFTSPFTSGSISLRLNNGTGTFGGGKEIAVADNYNAKKVLLADLGADSYLDILILTDNTSYSTGRIASLHVAAQVGREFPSTARPFRAIGTVPNSIASGDLNNDGFQEILTTAGAPNSEVIISDTQSITVGRSVGNLAVGDVNGDGFLDFVVANVDASNNRVVSVRLNAGNGTTTFTAGQDVLVDGSGGLALGDVNGDGNLDIVAEAGDGTIARVRLNNGTGSFSGTQEVAVVGTGLLLSDIDDNGTLDIVTSGSVRLNQASPSSLAITSLSPARNATAAPRTADVTATFNQALANNAATQSALKIFSQQAGGKKAGTATVNGNTLTFSPTIDFKPGETVFATITPAAQSGTGASLEKPQVFRFTTATSPSTGTFSLSSEVAAGNATGALVTGDLDGDGDLDLLVPSGTTPNAGVIRLNDGAGNFTTSQEIPAAATSNLLGDLDSDGDLDFVVGGTSYLNNGQGVFSAGSSFEAPGLMPSLHDMDADGDLDLLSTIANGINVRLNDGTGNFSTSTSFNTTERGITGYTAGDIDNDGDVDVLFGIERTGGATGIALNNGDATFTLGGRGITSLLQVPYLAVLEDVDGDGDLDLINAGSGQVEILLNNGTGSFSRGSVVEGGGAFIPALATGDVDGDGDIDLLIESGTIRGAYIRLNNGDGTFSGNGTIAFAASSNPLKLADIDGDGDLDLLAGTVNGASVYLNQNAGSFAVATIAPARNAVAAPRPTNVAVTFTQPLSTSAATQGALKVFSQQAGGQKAGAATVSGSTLTFDPTADFKPGETVFATLTTAAQSSSGASLAKPQVFQFTAATSPSNGVFSGGADPLAGANPYGVAAGDVDGDGDLDLLTANISSSTVSVRLNNGAGSFSGTQEVSTGRGPTQIVLSDVDGDGDLDFVTANSRSIFPSTVSVRLNNGAGSFSGGQDVAVGYTPHAVALGDIDGDGDLDLLAPNYTAGNSTTTSTVSVRLNNGLGSFSGTQEVSIGTRPLSIALGDVDGDGDLDFVTANSNTLTASVRLNDGLGTFSGSQEVPVEFNPESIVLGDVDGDGDLDLAVANQNSNMVNVRLNNGSGTFSGTQQLAVGATPHGVVLSDVDGDGDLDLATANTGSNTVSVRLNNGTGTFGGSQEVSVGAGPFSLALADVDGNGTLDLLTANSGGNSASVRLSGAATAQAKALAMAPARLSGQVNLYPNPARTSVRVQLPVELASQRIHVQVLNLLGQVVVEQALSAQPEPEVLLSSLPTGVYSLHLITVQGLITKRLIIK